MGNWGIKVKKLEPHCHVKMKTEPKALWPSILIDYVFVTLPILMHRFAVHIALFIFWKDLEFGHLQQ